MKTLFSAQISILIILLASLSLCVDEGDDEECNESLESALSLEISSESNSIQRNSTLDILVTLTNNGDCTHSIDIVSLIHHTLTVSIITPTNSTIYYTQAVTSLPRSTNLKTSDNITQTVTIGGNPWNYDGGDTDWFMFELPGEYYIEAKYKSGRAENEKSEEGLINSNIIVIEVV